MNASKHVIHKRTITLIKEGRIFLFISKTQILVFLYFRECSKYIIQQRNDFTHIRTFSFNFIIHFIIHKRFNEDT
jgi:hypothetical protein